MKSQDQDGREPENVVSAAALVFLKQLEDLADVRLGLKISSHRKAPVGPLLVLAKTTFRKLFQGLINELMRKQTLFNEAMIQLSYVTYRDIRSLVRATQAMGAGLEERIRRLEERVARLERDSPAATEAGSKGSDSVTPIDLNNEKN